VERRVHRQGRGRRTDRLWVAPVQGLIGTGKLLHGPDLSFESQSPAFRYLDTFGHGTHMAGIIAGRDTGWNAGSAASVWSGIAPDARLLSLKIADAQGATDVSQVLAAIDWVVKNKNRNGLNIRVLNLSFGTDSGNSYMASPLSYAAEVAWRKGIFVSVSAGNDAANSTTMTGSDGSSSFSGSYVGRGLASPAFNPFLLAVGATDTNGTALPSDDTIANFSSFGGGRTVDLLAPGRSIVSLADPGSQLDLANPGARVGTRFFKGSGTSQAAAVMSGAAALLLQKHPTATPNQLKKLLTQTAKKLTGPPTLVQGNGAVDLTAARTTTLPSTSTAAQTFTASTGTGSLGLDRGSSVLESNGVALVADTDIFGRAFVSSSWAAAANAGTSWNGGSWRGATWAGSGWSGDRNLTATWSGSSWAGTAWSSVTYSGSRWTGSRWTGNGWTGSRWTGSRWTGAAWAGAGWN
jgi:serine protease AprX